MKTRLDLPGYQANRNVEKQLVKGVQSDFGNYCDEITFVTEIYKADINKDSLKVQLETLRMYFERQESERIKFKDVVDYLRRLEAEVVTLLVIPAKNATSARTFSALRRIKTFLRSTMTQAEPPPDIACPQGQN